MAAILMLKNSLNTILSVMLITNKMLCASVQTRNDSAIYIHSSVIYYLFLHLRLSTIFYNTGLLFITGYSLSNSSLILSYGVHVNMSVKLLILVKECKDESIQSISKLYSNARWYERETAEMLGAKFLGLVDSRSLLLPYNMTINPIKKNVPSNNTSLLVFNRLSSNLSWYNI